MHNSENIKKILELNKKFPSLVVDESADIIEANKDFYNRFQNENNLYNLFDRNTGLLVKNSFIDVKAFSKVQRRKVQFELNESSTEAELIISPFMSDDKTYYFVVLFWNTYNEHLIVYPTIDDNSLTRKYRTILNRLDDSLPQTLIEKKNFQYELDIEKEPIFIISDKKFLFVNNSFTGAVRLNEDEIKTNRITDIFEYDIAQKLNLADEVCSKTKNIIIIESIDYSPDDLQQKNRIIKFPILDFNKDVIATINFGTIEAKRDEKKLTKVISSDSTLHPDKNPETNEESLKEEFAEIEYNPDNFKILKANNAAADLYGYSIDELLKMDITDLCSPEDIQKLLLPQSKEIIEFKHIRKDGSIIEVEIQTEQTEVNNEKTLISIIKTKLEKSDKTEKNEPVTETTDKSENNNSGNDVIIKENNLEQTSQEKTVNPDKEKPAKETSFFLSSLFHEILTPVNVILGFVQEIIDSIDKPTEEQEESAKIIKDNQQLLLQTMNIAVQYSKLEENKLPIKNEEFVLNKYLLDLKDSLSGISEKENVEIVFVQLEEEITLKNDRQKLLAAVSYFIKSAIKIVNTAKLNIAIFKENDRVYFSLNTKDDKATEKLIDNLVELYNNENSIETKNYRISPIALQLSKKLNEITGAKVEKKFIEDAETIVISFPVNKKEEKGIETENNIEIDQEKEEIETPFEKDETVKKENIKAEQENEVEKVEPVVKDPLIIKSEKESIDNHSVEEEIIKDIEEEEEITNEEIVTEEPIYEEKTEINEIIEEIEEKDLIEKLSCLLIEDSVDSQLLFKTQMKDFKLLKIVSGLTEALPLIKKYKFDLIYVDINLKGQYNGLDALKIIRQFENYKTVPIIAVTAYPFDGDKEKFLNAGFTDYFRKPLLKENLLDSINSLF